MVEVVNKSNFQEKVLDVKDKPSLVVFKSQSCPPCVRLTPVVEELSGEIKDNVNCYFVDVSQDQELAIKYGIMSIPVSLLFKNGELQKKAVGFMPKEKLKESLGI